MKRRREERVGEEDTALYFYRDAQQAVQGPFALGQMCVWLAQGWFSDDTPVAVAATEPLRAPRPDQFRPLREHSICGSDAGGGTMPQRLQSPSPASTPAEPSELTFPCLSFREPFGSLLLNGAKTTESRWQPYLQDAGDGALVAVHIAYRQWEDPEAVLAQVLPLRHKSHTLRCTPQLQRTARPPHTPATHATTATPTAPTTPANRKAAPVAAPARESLTH